MLDSQYRLQELQHKESSAKARRTCTTNTKRYQEPSRKRPSQERARSLTFCAVSLRPDNLPLGLKRMAEKPSGIVKRKDTHSATLPPSEWPVTAVNRSIFEDLRPRCSVKRTAALSRKSSNICKQHHAPIPRAESHETPPLANCLLNDPQWP